MITFDLANKQENKIIVGNMALINEDALNQDYLNSHIDDWGS